MGLTGRALADYAISMKGTPYVYGAKVQDGILTQAKVDWLAKRYPDHYTRTYLNKIKNKGLVGKVCVDCSGLISAYTNKIIGSYQLKSTANRVIPYKDYKTFAVGTVLWKSGHVGVFCGQDEKGNYFCMEAKGIDYGTVKTILTPSTKWTYGLQFNYMDYVSGQQTPIFIPSVTTKTNPYKESTITVKKGSKGDGVKWVQFELREAGFDHEFVYNGKKYGPVLIDGDAGKTTDAAIRAYQTSSKLKADGKVGPNTRTAFKAD